MKINFTNSLIKFTFHSSVVWLRSIIKAAMKGTKKVTAAAAASLHTAAMLSEKKDTTKLNGSGKYAEDRTGPPNTASWAQPFPESSVTLI